MHSNQLENVSWASLLGNLSCGQVEGVCSTLVEEGPISGWELDVASGPRAKSLSFLCHQADGDEEEIPWADEVFAEEQKPLLQKLHQAGCVKLQRFDAYVKRVVTRPTPEARAFLGEEMPKNVELVMTCDPVVCGVVVPSDEAIVRAEVEGVPFEIVARIPVSAKPGQIIQLNLGAPSEYFVEVPPGFHGGDLIPYWDCDGGRLELKVPVGLSPGDRFQSPAPCSVTLKAPQDPKRCAQQLAFMGTRDWQGYWLVVGPLPGIFPGECVPVKLPPGDTVTL